MGSLVYCQLYIVSLFVKLLLFPSYISTDFEVHRNWLAITLHLPLSEWYKNATSIWTLDYPLFFAFFEWILSKLASMILDPTLLKLSKTPIVNSEIIAFQRTTVIASELFLIWSSIQLINSVQHYNRRTQATDQDKKPSESNQIDNAWKYITFAAVALNPGLLYVDHIHFQYNGFLIGILIWSINYIYQGHILKAAIIFSCLLNFKHIFLYQAPAYFIYILSSYCFSTIPQHRHNRVIDRPAFLYTRFIKVAIASVFPFIVSLGPFVLNGTIGDLLSQLFPFKRGLCHAYWAPNFWALYTFADRALLQVVKRAKLGSFLKNKDAMESTTRGLIGDSKFSILPNIPPNITLMFTIWSMIPSLYVLWRKPSPNNFLKTLILCGLASFEFGWHVHEKAILICLIPMTFLSGTDVVWASQWFVLQVVGHIGIWPLLFRGTELPAKILILLIYIIALHQFMAPRILLSQIERFYLWMFVPLMTYTEFIHPLISKTYTFLPLMMTSVYCSIGISATFFRLVYDFVRENAK